MGLEGEVEPPGQLQRGRARARRPVRMISLETGEWSFLVDPDPGAAS